MSHPKARSPVSLSDVVDSVPAILWTADPATLTFTWVSSGAEAILGYPLDDWLKPDFWRDHTHPDDRQILGVLQAKDLTEREVVYRMISADGRIVWLRDCVRRTANEISGFLIDITSERAAHDALARSEENYRRLVHTMPDGIGVHTKGRFIYVNPKFREIFAAQHESELIGREVLSLVHPDFREIVRNRLVRVAVGENVPVTREKLIRIDGRAFDAEVMAIPVVFNGANAVQVVVRDITEQIKTAERLELLSAGTNEAIWEGDRTTNEFWTNDRFREMIGDAPDLGAAQKKWMDALHPDDRERTIARLQERMARHATEWSEEYRIRNRAGDYIWVLDRGKRVLDEQGNAVRVVGALVDVTDTRRISSLGQLAASLAHEFNNVLMTIQSFTEVLARTTPPTEAATKAQKQIIDAVARGKRVTAEILAYAKPAPPQVEPIDAEPWLRAVCESLRSVSVSLNVRAPGRILGDKYQLEQVIVNLVMNARDATPEGGAITIELDRNEITVRDTGTGIAPDVLPHIFEPLFTTKRGGTGLGLAIARRLVERQNGSISVETKLGAGTAFHLRLPAA